MRKAVFYAAVCRLLCREIRQIAGSRFSRRLFSQRRVWLLGGAGVIKPKSAIRTQGVDFSTMTLLFGRLVRFSLRLVPISASPVARYAFGKAVNNPLNINEQSNQSLMTDLG